jgi:hypothetical protein
MAIGHIPGKGINLDQSSSVVHDIQKQEGRTAIPDFPSRKKRTAPKDSTFKEEPPVPTE